MRVFILDDNKLLREHLWHALGRIDVAIPAVLCFENVMDLMSNFDSEQPDFIFIRLGNTAFSGLCAAEKIKKRDESVRIVFISQTDRYAPYAFQAGAAGFLLEPLDEGKLSETLFKSTFRGNQNAKEKA